jgi:hypothetical protein
MVKGDSTESSNPFAEDDDCSGGDEESSSKNEQPVSRPTKDDVILPEWLVELPDDLEVHGTTFRALNFFFFDAFLLFVD